MRSRKFAVAAAACAFVLVPAATASAGSGPVPDSSKRAPAKSTAPSAQGNPRSLKAEAVGVCPDAYQIGTTGYVKRGSETIASVKQFYSPTCQENYGYLWVWQGFRDKHGDYDVNSAVYSYSQDEVLGARAWTDSNGQEYWSYPTDTVRDCTAAVGAVRPAGSPLAYQAASSKRC
ncbi:hypothetical protein DVA86_29355 [Streptomyces armeniacus]|uniref:DUF2690 domain-containing protein n=1 Tax=Streptomyces armeniacus TaxID=83291 RepID=A0A345XWS8_9ACTN|nr:hypothetical protein [Streptomyces armeniacus]AXK36094.1 hypothetical protein DVA86_29355 [Streptomyces armeniacus]